jgi:sulfur relay (sulfurtransferase) DsrC/TusE family protein
MKPIIDIFDAETKEMISREMNDEEYSQYLIDSAEWEAQRAERLAKQAEIDAAKAAIHEKLAELGITPELIEVIKKL